MQALVIFIGGVGITILISYFFYMRAARDLLRETKELRRLIKLTLRALDSAGLVEFVRDRSGEITGIVIEGHVRASVASSASFVQEVKKRRDKEEEG